jgi:hypothetical protein
LIKSTFFFSGLDDQRQVGRQKGEKRQGLEERKKIQEGQKGEKGQEKQKRKKGKRKGVQEAPSGRHAGAGII